MSYLIAGFRARSLTAAQGLWRKYKGVKEFFVLFLFYPFFFLNLSCPGMWMHREQIRGYPR